MVSVPRLQFSSHVKAIPHSKSQCERFHKRGLEKKWLKMFHCSVLAKGLIGIFIPKRKKLLIARISK